MTAVRCLQAGALPGHWPHVTLALGQGFNLTAFALSLLLVFRCAAWGRIKISAVCTKGWLGLTWTGCCMPLP